MNQKLKLQRRYTERKNRDARNARQTDRPKKKSVIKGSLSLDLPSWSPLTAKLISPELAHLVLMDFKGRWSNLLTNHFVHPSVLVTAPCSRCQMSRGPWVKGEFEEGKRSRIASLWEITTDRPTIQLINQSTDWHEGSYTSIDMNCKL